MSDVDAGQRGRADGTPRESREGREGREGRARDERARDDGAIPAVGPLSGARLMAALGWSGLATVLVTLWLYLGLVGLVVGVCLGGLYRFLPAMYAVAAGQFALLAVGAVDASTWQFGLSWPTVVVEAGLLVALLADVVDPRYPTASVGSTVLATVALGLLAAFAASGGGSTAVAAVVVVGAFVLIAGLLRWLVERDEARTAAEPPHPPTAGRSGGDTR